MVANTRTTRRTGAARPLNQPVQLSVRSKDDGPPKALKLRGRWVDVDVVSDRWRVDDEWWRERPLSRMYYECVVDQGLKVVVFKDLITGEWYQQRT